MFVSRGAIRPMGTTWSEELRIVAANAWWLSAFFVAFDLAYKQELDSGGGAVLDCLRLWVAAWLNHGNGIRKCASLAQDERSVSARSPPRWSAREWADAVAAVGRDVLQDGAPASAGRQTLGCLEFLRQLEAKAGKSDSLPYAPTSTPSRVCSTIARSARLRRCST